MRIRAIEVVKIHGTEQDIIAKSMWVVQNVTFVIDKEGDNGTGNISISQGSRSRKSQIKAILKECTFQIDCTFQICGTNFAK